MKDATTALERLTVLADAGVRLAIDDFGTGYSSLAYLQKLPAHVVKIDQSFVFGIENYQREQSLVRSMIAMSHGKGYSVVGDGVETAAAARLLAEMGWRKRRDTSSASPWRQSKSSPGHARINHMALRSSQRRLESTFFCGRVCSRDL
jgi:sensor c-di-GMP phosphodiesterase-like protein